MRRGRYFIMQINTEGLTLTAAAIAVLTPVTMLLFRVSRIVMRIEVLESNFKDMKDTVDTLQDVANAQLLSNQQFEHKLDRIGELLQLSMEAHQRYEERVYGNLEGFLSMHKDQTALFVDLQGKQTALEARVFKIMDDQVAAAKAAQ